MYKDLYALYRHETLASEHPEWVLKAQHGNKLHIPFGYEGGTCPMYAGHIGTAYCPEGPQATFDP